MKVKLLKPIKKGNKTLLAANTIVESDYVGNQLNVRVRFGKYVPVEHKDVEIIESYKPF